VLILAAVAHVHGNVIQDSGGESGFAWLPGWTVGGPLTPAAYAGGGPLSPSSPGPKNRGNDYFWGGPNNALSVAKQSFDLSPLSKRISSGTLRFALSGWLGGRGHENDSATLLAIFSDASGKTLKTVTVTSSGAKARKGRTELLFRHLTGKVPTRTARVTVELLMKRAKGGHHANNDGLADNLSFLFK
jgi:hypothetical protein